MATTTVDVAAFDALCADVLAKAAELEALRVQVVELEQLATVQSDNLQRYAAFESTWNRKQAELRAERDDARAKLAAAQAELHDLRIQAAFGLPVQVEE